MPARPLILATFAVTLLASCSPPAAVLAPADRLAQAWQQFRLEDFDHAEQSFHAVLDHAAPADTALRANATYGLGLIASLSRHGDSTAEARTLFEQAIALDPSASREQAAWAALAIVRDQQIPARSDASPLAAPERTALLDAYTHIIDTYPATPAAEEAFAWRCTLLVDTLNKTDAQNAARVIAEYLAAHPAAKNRTVLYTLLSTAHETLGDYPNALAASISAVESKEPDLTNPRQNNILEYYRIAMMAQFDVGDFATARKYYNKFLAEYPRDQRAFNVQLLLKHLDDTEARLKAGLPPQQLSALAAPDAAAPATGGAQ